MSSGLDALGSGAGAWFARLDEVEAYAQARRGFRARAAAGEAADAFASGFGELFAHEILAGRTITGGIDEERARRLETPRTLRLPRNAGEFGVTFDERRGGGSIPKLAAGYQPAVVKVVSYAGNCKRASATARYVQRDGIALETQDGEKLNSHEAVQAEIDRWSTTFRDRAESQDAASVRLRVAGLRDDVEGRERLGAVVRSAFEGHPHAFRVGTLADGSLEAQAVVVLAGAGKERFRIRDRQAGTNGDGPVRKVFDASSESAMKARIESGAGVGPHRIDFAPGLPVHGVSGLTHRLDALIEGGAAQDQNGRSIGKAVEVRKTAQAWRARLRSNGPRETMHLVMSAKAGVDLEAFMATAREFLRSQFPDHRFLFAVHTDKASEGHVHAHAIVVLRSLTGEKLHPGRQDFAQWRRTYAEVAQAHGLKIVATHAAERASSQSYGARDKAIVDAAERPRPHRAERDRAYAAKNPHVVAAARQRIETARANPVRAPKSAFERQIAKESAVAWLALAQEGATQAIAKAMSERLAVATLVDAILTAIANRLQAYETGASVVAKLTADQMYKDLRTIDKTVASVAERLTGPTQQAFMARSQDYLVRLAARVDIQRAIEGGAQRLSREEVVQRAGSAGERIVAEAERIASAEARQANSAETAARAVLNAELRDEGVAPGASAGRPDAIVEERQAAALTPRNSQADRREADAAAQAARMARQNPASPIPAALAESDRLNALRREQEALVKRMEDEAEGEHSKGQRIR